MGAPFELVAGPMSLYVAVVGQAQPEISATPPAAWMILGYSLSEDGLVVNPEETVNKQKTLDSPQTKKLFRSEDDLTLTCTLLDLTVEALARVMNGKAVITTAAGSGAGGYREITLGRGFDVKMYAVLARGMSPYGDNFNAQYWIPNAYVSSGGPTYVKGEAAGLELEIMCVNYDLGSSVRGYGRYRGQNALPT